MAEEVVLTVAAELILQKLVSSASEEISLAWGLKGEIKSLNKKLTMVQALLRDYSESARVKGEALTIWLRNLEDVAYHADDVLDEFAFEILRRKVEIRNQFKKKVLCFFSLSNPVVFRFKMAQKVKSINSTLLDVENEAIRLGLREIKKDLSPQVVIDIESSRETHFHVDDSEVVGRKDDVSEIVNTLISSSINQEDVLSVLPIVGMGGLGKTTLAQLVYKDEQVNQHFNVVMWVSVSDDFDVKKILSRILESLNMPAKESKNAMVQSLREELAGKNYILVLDDVWNEDPVKWEDLRTCLLGISATTRNGVIVTTRTDDVASIMGTLGSHHLKNLPEVHCWTVFEQRAFASGGPPKTPEFEAIGRQVAKKCAGVPLAAKVLGGMLHSKKEKSDWLSIQNSEIWTLPEDKNGILRALKLSFHHLSLPSLKQCFAYSSIFQKDFNIEKDDLIQLRMAQGFLQPFERSNQEMEDVGNKYFNILLSNSLFQDVVKDEFDNVRACKMHDLVRDLALSVSKYDYLILKAGDEFNNISVLRHLTVISNEEKLPKNLEESAQKLRTFDSRGSLLGMLKNFRYLRVLSLGSRRIQELPSSISKLKHLRYLELSSSKIKALPDSITKLYNLQTLRLFHCRYLKELPKQFRRLISLRHLCMDDDEENRKLMPMHIGELTCLQTLPFFVVGQDNGCKIEELGCLKNLRGELKIYHLEHVRNREEAQKANLLRNSNIHLLKFHWSEEREEGINNDEDVLEGLKPHENLKSLTIENFEGGKFPSWVMMMMIHKSHLHNLVKIKLVNCNKCEQMPTMGHLYSLKVVEIDGMPNLKRIGTEFYGHDDGASSSSSGAVASVAVFPALRELTLENMPNLAEWLEVLSGMGMGMVFPYLEKLKIAKCPELITAPGHFPSLKQLRIEGIKHCWALTKMNRELSSLTSLEIENASGGSSELSSVLQELLVNNKHSLRVLKIKRCEELSYLPNGLQNLTSLENLEIGWCPNLTFIPDLHSLAASLRQFGIGRCEKLNCLPNKLETLVSLQLLSIHNCPNLMAIPDLRSLTSLQMLQIVNCEKLTYWPEGLLCLTNLGSLGIGGFSKELDYFPWPSEDIRQHLLSLKRLVLFGGPKLKSLPEQLEHHTFLEFLGIVQFERLEALPEWLGNLSSLQSLRLWGCNKLMNLPPVEAMRRLTCLVYLEIKDCQLLKERCTKESGPEWYKIARIPEIKIDEQIIQSLD